ncbi:hypothetical protein BRADO4290 [Bradyrhizobium sp. ORS 278]|nr:hypothetical protein BRADO4290 [Bradyrhizobium sp. ORS 278]
MSCQPCPGVGGGARKNTMVASLLQQASSFYAGPPRKQERCYFGQLLVLSADAAQAPCNRMKLPGDIP